MAKIYYTPTAYSKDLSPFALTEEQANALAYNAENNPGASADAVLAGANNPSITEQISAQEYAVKAQADKDALTARQTANQSWLESAAKNVARPAFAALSMPEDFVHNIIRGYSNNINKGTDEYNLFDGKDFENTVNSTAWGNVVEETYRAMYANEAYGENKDIQGLGSDWFIADNEKIMQDKLNEQAQLIGYNSYEDAKKELGGISLGQVTTQGIHNNSVLKDSASTIIDTAAIALGIIGITNAPAAVGKVIKGGKFLANSTKIAEATTDITKTGKLVSDARVAATVSPELKYEAQAAVRASKISDARKEDLINDMNNEGIPFNQTLENFARDLNDEAQVSHSSVRSANEKEDILRATDEQASGVAKAKEVKLQAQNKKAVSESEAERISVFKEVNSKKMDTEILSLQKQVDDAVAAGAVEEEVIKLQKEIAIRQSYKEALIADNVDIEIPAAEALANIAKQVDVDAVPSYIAAGKAEGVNTIANVLLQKHYDEMQAAAETVRGNYKIAGEIGNPIEYLKDIQGLRRGITGEEKLNVDSALRFFTGKHMNGIAESILLVNKAKNPLAKMRKWIGNALPLDSQRALANAGTVDEVKAIFAEAISKGDLTFGNAKLRVLRKAATLIDPITGERKLISDYTKIIDKINHVYSKTTIWGKEAADIKVPWAIEANPEDADAMVELIDSLIKFTTGSFRSPWNKFNAKGRIANVKNATKKQDKLEALLSTEPKLDGPDGVLWRDIQEKYVQRMMEATNAFERRTVFHEAQNEMFTIAAKIHNLDAEETALFLKSAKTSVAYQNDLRVFLAKASADNYSNKLIDEGIDALNNEYRGAHLTELSIIAEEHMSQKLFMIDPYEMRKALATGKSLKEQWKRGGILGDINSISSLVGTVYDKMFRRLILLRMGYVIRNINETQLRMFFTGHPTYLTNPFLLASMLVNPSSKIGKIISGARKGATDVKGEAFIKEVDLEDINAAENARLDMFNKTTARNTSLLDPGFFNTLATRLGFKKVTVGDPEYTFGMANEILRASSAEVNRDVLAALAGKPLPLRITNWGKKTGKDNLLAEDLVSEYYWSGPGSEIIDGLRQTNKGANAEMYATKEALRDYLFGDVSYSRKTYLNDITDGFDSEFIDVMLEAKYYKTEKIVDEATGKTTEVLTNKVDIYPRVPGDKRATVKSTKPVVGVKEVVQGDTIHTQQLKATQKLLNRKLGERMRNAPEQLRVQEVQAPVFLEGKNVGKADMEQYEGFFDWATDAVFSTSSYFERKFALEPEYMYSYWDVVNNFVGALSPKEAAEILKNANKALKSAPFTWAQRTLNKIENAVKKANGDGNFTIDDLDNAAHVQGATAVKKAFYDASQRNAFAHSLRFIDPFAQAYGNSVKTFARLAVKAPQRVYLWQRAIAALQSEGSGWVYNTWLYGQDEYDSNKPFIFTDQVTGEKVFGVPFAGIPGLIATGDAKSTSMTMNFDSTNVLFQNGLYPGIGPIIQMPYNFMMKNPEFARIAPTWLGDMISPTGGKTELPSIFESVAPAWSQELAAGLQLNFADPERLNKYLPGAMIQAVQSNPGKYQMDEGKTFYTEVGLESIKKDAYQIAAGLAIGKAFTMFFAIGQVDIKTKVKDYNGVYHLQSSIQTEFYDSLKNGMSQAEAYQALGDKYGPQASLAMITGNKGNFAPRDAAWNAIQDNPELLPYADDLSYFYTGGGYSVEIARIDKKNGKYTIEELSEQVNNINYNTEVSELQRLLVMGQKGMPGGITQPEYKDRKRTLEQSYDKVPKLEYNFDTKTEEHASIEEALKRNPELASTESGTAAAIYFDAFNERVNPNMPALSSNAKLTNGMTIKDELYSLGQQLCIDYPEFVVMWEDVLKSQVRPEN